MRTWSSGAEVTADDVAKIRQWAGLTFNLAGEIYPLAGPDGLVLDELPAERYDNVARLPLNRHGSGPFCSLVVPGLPAIPGYVVTSGETVVYTGIAVDLRGASLTPSECGRSIRQDCDRGSGTQGSGRGRELQGASRSAALPSRPRGPWCS